VLVNGHAIPFNMKIGEAGEAFFVFETDEDVPEDLMTSPILQATSPSELGGASQKTGRFGAKDSGVDADTKDIVDGPEEQADKTAKEVCLYSGGITSSCLICDHRTLYQSRISWIWTLLNHLRLKMSPLSLYCHRILRKCRRLSMHPPPHSNQRTTLELHWVLR
jgi:lipin, N-terminal conserved region